MNVSACILVLTLMIVWLCPYQINKWNYDFCYVTVIVTRQPFRVGVLHPYPPKEIIAILPPTVHCYVATLPHGLKFVD